VVPEDHRVIGPSRVLYVGRPTRARLSERVVAGCPVGVDLGDVVILLSFLFIFWVTRVNSFAASNSRVEKDQIVIETGPYAHVRHPMYAAAIWLFVGMPLALGSWWSLGLIVPFMPVLAWRLLDEEKILQRDLTGYTEYMRRVRFRLVPFVW
jgi:protein-S-isoprenylcysteine O-methyltransferase Ste14